MPLTSTAVGWITSLGLIGPIKPAMELTKMERRRLNRWHGHHLLMGEVRMAMALF